MKTAFVILAALQFLMLVVYGCRMVFQEPLATTVLTLIGVFVGHLVFRVLHTA